MPDWDISRFAGSSRRLRSVVTCLVGLILILVTGYLDPIFKSVAPALKPFVDFIREVGFALVVAIVIWLVFEYFARAENEAMWKDRVQEIVSDVFYAVYRSKLPSEYIELANQVILSPQFMRTGWQLDYSLRDVEYQDGGKAMPYVAVTCVSRFEINNITSKAQAFPIRVSLPNPIHKAMKEKVGVAGVLIWRDGKKQEIDLREADRDFRARIQSDTFQVPFIVGSIEVHPQEKIEIALTFTLAKLVEDTEVLQSTYPSDALRISIVDHGPSKRLIGARSIHPDLLEQISPAGADDTYQFRINRYLIPNHGVVIWWRSI